MSVLRAALGERGECYLGSISPCEFNKSWGRAGPAHLQLHSYKGCKLKEVSLPCGQDLVTTFLPDGAW